VRRRHAGTRRGSSIHRGIIADASSPIAYGYAGTQLPVYYKGDVVLSTGGGGFGGFGGGGPWQNTTPMATRPELSPWTPDADNQVDDSASNQDEMAQFRAMAAQFGFGGSDGDGPRVVMRFPEDPDRILLSGTLDGAPVIAGSPQVVDAPVGEGHVVMFAIRPFWRWQTQGTFFLGFNAILNWNDLDAGATSDAVGTGRR